MFDVNKAIQIAKELKSENISLLALAVIFVAVQIGLLRDEVSKITRMLQNDQPE